MNKSIQNKGWNSMKSILDDTMPTRDNHKGKLILLGLLLISIAWILGYYFGIKSDSENIETPVTTIVENSESQQSNTKITPDKINTISDAMKIESKTELLTYHEDVNIPSNRIRTLVEISPIRQIESSIDYVSGTNNTLIESHIEEAKLSSREEILFDSPSIPLENYSTIPNGELISNNGNTSKNILDQKSILLIDEPAVDLDMNEVSITVIQPEQAKQGKHLFGIVVAATTQAYAIRHVGIQSGIDYSYRFSPKLALFINSGAELRNIYNTNLQVLIKEPRSTNQIAEAGFSLNGKHNMAQVDYDYMISAYVGTGLQYNLSSKWIIYTGFTFHPLISVAKRAVSHLPTYADGSPNVEILYPEEIELNYNMNHSYELSTSLGATYFPLSRIGITMFYQHGFRGLLKYDLQSFDLSRRGIGLGIQYVL
jgi:hypothetical protein